MAMVLSMNAYMLFLAGVRVAMTGHVTACFPVLRTALESACYGFLIAKDPDLSAVWADRHKDADSKKVCRKAFGSAVTDVAKLVEREQPGGGQWLSDAYDAAIDFGAHPNIKSVFGHVRILEDVPEDPYFRVNLAGLYGAETFARVSQSLNGNRVEHKHAAYAEHPSLFAGVVWDGDGRRLTPNHANKAGVRYRYYISRKDKERLDLPIVRVPAGDLENLLILQLHRHGGVSWDGPRPTRELILATISKVTVHLDRVAIEFIGSDEPVSIPATLVRCSGEKRIAAAPEHYAHPRQDAALIKLVVRAHQARKALAEPENPSLDAAASSMRVSTPYFCSLLRLAHLAPDITTAILDGRQPAHLNRQFLARINNLPIDWQGQREMLGFA